MSAACQQQKQNQQLTWPDKYKPKSFGEMIGVSDQNSSAKKLLAWLLDKNAKKSRAVLISGPSGIGKTLCAQLACKEAGYSLVEFNASNSRSSKLFKQVLSECTTSRLLSSFLSCCNQQAIAGHRARNGQHCILMDEVDGMDGCADRGSMADLISAIKHTKIPIICICNELSPKLKSLKNHCLDLRFVKPRLDQARVWLTRVCSNERVQISRQMMDQVIVSSNHDMRQCLTNLSVWSSNNKVLTRLDIGSAVKDTRVGLFDSCSRIFQSAAARSLMQEKFDRFFDNYSLVPLFVQENYLSIAGSPSFSFTHSDASQSVCTADTIGRQMRTSNNWSLLPTQAIFAAVVPGTLLASSSSNQNIRFPTWLAKNSSHSRLDRQLQEMHKHMSLHTTVNKNQLYEYVSVFGLRLSDPLIKSGTAGILSVLKLMNDYGLTRQDFDTITELHTFGKTAANLSICSKVKAAFTRAYNSSNQIKSNNKNFKKQCNLADEDESENEMPTSIEFI